MSLREAIEASQELFVQQRKEWTEIVIDFETRNRYAVMDTSGTSIGVVSPLGLRRGRVRCPRRTVLCGFAGVRGGSRAR